MFLDYYGLKEQPFGVTPDPRFLYLGTKHREALAALAYGTEGNRGFLALIAKPGMGKTSLLFKYLEDLRTKARTVFVFQTNGDPCDLMRYILADLDLDATGKDLPEMHALLNRVLLEEVRAGRQFILVIDEAQNLDERVLESIRLLSNFETPCTKLMQIVLAGQPYLAERLASASMAQLRQRISFIIRIEPFTREEVEVYIEHRLLLAGYKGPPIFTDGARLLIAEHSDGIPRNINNICFNAMSLGWALEQKPIDRDMVRDIVADLDLNPKVVPSNIADRVLQAAAVQPLAPALPLPVIAKPIQVANLQSPAQALQHTPLGEPVSSPWSRPKTSETHAIRPIRKATARSALTYGASGVMPSTVPLGADTPHGRILRSRKGVLIAVGFLLLLVVGVAVGGYRIYGQGQGLPDAPALQQAGIFPRDEGAPAFRHLNPLFDKPIAVALNSNPLPAAGVVVGEYKPPVEHPVNRSQTALSAGASLPVGGRSGPVIETLHAPIRKTLVNPDLLESSPPLVGAVKNMDGTAAVSVLLDGIGANEAPPPPGSYSAVGGHLQPPQLISSIPPVYPAGARMQRVQGVVVLDALVDETGKVVETTVIAGPLPLKSAAKEALQKWRYQPARMNGEPIQIHIKVNMRFGLN